VTGQIALIWLMTFVIGLAELDRCVSTTAQVLSGVVDSPAGLRQPRSATSWVGR
jgi:hypothetical protein